jgi:hypothetical protein
VGKGEAKDSRCDEAVFAIDCSVDGGRGFVLVRRCAGTVGGFIRGGVFYCDVVPHSMLRCDKGGMMGVLGELV